MSFKNSGGYDISAAGDVSGNDTLLISRNNTNEIIQSTIQEVGEALGFVTSVSVEQFVTSSYLHTNFITLACASSIIHDEVSAQISAGDFITSADASAQIHNEVSAQISAGDYFTSSEASVFIHNEVSAQISAGDYFTSSEASVFIHNEVSAQISAGDYFTSSEASVFIHNEVSAQISAGDYVTSAEVSALVSVQISAQLSAQISAKNYITSAQASVLITSFDYITSASVCAGDTFASVCSFTIGLSAFVSTDLGYAGFVDGSFSIGLGVQNNGANNSVLGASTSVSGYNNAVFGISSYVNGEYNNVFGSEASIDGQTNLAMGTIIVVSGNNNEIIGRSNRVYSYGNTVVGALCSINGNSNNVFGEEVDISGNENLAAGYFVSVSGNRNHVFGSFQDIDGSSNNAIGESNLVRGSYNTVIGYDASVCGDNNIAIGNVNKILNSTYSINIGFTNVIQSSASSAAGNKQIAIGYNCNTDNSSENSIVIGSDSNMINGLQAIAIGFGAMSRNDYSIAIGASASAGASTSSITGAIAIGRRATAAFDESIAIGVCAKTSATLEATFGRRVFRLGVYNVSSVPTASTFGAAGIAYISDGASSLPVVAFSDGTNWLRCDTLDIISETSSTASAVSASPATPLFHVRDEKTAGTAAGTFTAGAWQTRTLNTIITNEISGASLSANQITLPIGTYEFEAFAPAFAVHRHKCALYNVTDATYILIGPNQYGITASAQTDSRVAGKFLLSAINTLELRHRCSTTRTTDGFGLACSFGVPEVYADVMIWKVT